MLDKFKGLLGKIPTGTLSGVTLALILWLTLAPHPAGNLQLPLFPGADKIIHGIMFGFLGIVILLEWMKKRNWKPLTLPDVAVVAFAVSALGVAIEFVQRAMGMGRTLEIYDMLADAAGAMIAAFGFSMVQTFLKNPDD